MVTDTAVCNFADDTTIFAADCQLDKVLERLETDALILSKWFPENFMKLNAGKCHLLTFGTNQDDIKIKIGEAIVEESSEEKLLGVIQILISKVTSPIYAKEPAKNCMLLLEFRHLWVLINCVS